VSPVRVVEWHDGNGSNWLEVNVAISALVPCSDFLESWAQSTGFDAASRRELLGCVTMIQGFAPQFAVPSESPNGYFKFEFAFNLKLNLAISNVSFLLINPKPFQKASGTASSSRSLLDEWRIAFAEHLESYDQERFSFLEVPIAHFTVSFPWQTLTESWMARLFVHAFSLADIVRSMLHITSP
jgi:hypothetical protein